MPAPEIDPDDLVLTLATDDSWLHAATASETVAHAAQHRAGGHGTHGPARVEFYDMGGRRLEPVVGHDLVVRGFATTDDAPEPDRVATRIDAVLDRAEAFLAARAQADPGPHVAGPAGASAAALPFPSTMEVPRPTGGLDEVVPALRDRLVPPPNFHVMGWFHNLLHALG